MIRAAFAFALLALVASCGALAPAFAIKGEVASRPGPVVKVVTDGHGSGVHLGDGLILTAAHVIADKPFAMIKTDDGRSVKAARGIVDHDADLAILIARGFAGASSELACRDPIVGEEIVAVGNPFNLELARTWGRVSLPPPPRGDTRSAFVADLTVAPGMSGGPVYDKDGLVLGVVVAMAIGRITGGVAFFPFAYIVPSTSVCAILGE